MSVPSVCLHAHFYQPSRENPWTGEWEDQPSAAPYPNWNARIADECYAQNAAARLLDGEGRTRGVRNNYADISFDVGPTLLRWLEVNRPVVYAAILRADRQVEAQRAGTGPAVAQGYHHAILPLCDAQDLETEIVWGLRDFEQRFGRPAAGIWLPETAVCEDTLEMVAERGVAFVVLAPHQAAALRPDGGEWSGVDAHEHWTQRAYKVELPSGRSLAAFFYDGGLARGVAFDGWLHNGEVFAERLVQAGEGDGLVHLATDGESYGHHHAFGEMALARTCEMLAERNDVKLATYGAYLADHPPTWQAQVVGSSSWSCAHGVERWRSDCGCKMDPGADTQQRWRTGLRNALDWLRDEARAAIETPMQALFLDPREAMLHYVDVVHETGAAWDAWWLEHGRPGADDQWGRDFLEVERHLLAMYTSCAWFFDDATGIEARQNLRHAACVVDGLRNTVGIDLSRGLLDHIHALEVNGDSGALSADVAEWLRPSEPEPVEISAKLDRQAGTVLHLTSLPGPGPIGDMGGARAFVDWMELAGLSVWQLLPTSPTGYGDSPYSSWSSLSGNPWLIALEPLAEAGLLDAVPVWEGEADDAVDFGAAYAWKNPLLERAARALLADADHAWTAEYQAFLTRADWVHEAGLFWALKRQHGGQAWWAWAPGLRDRDAAALEAAKVEHRELIAVWTVLEFFFEKQWQAMRTYCTARGVTLLGDLPIYVGEDSVDVWAHRGLFQLDEAGTFSHVAGVPPDAYSEDGQRWGNPLYDWQAMTDDGFAWWVARMRRALALTDTVRIDHFIGMVRYWAIPASADTARDGQWLEGPGMALFEALSAALGTLHVVVEDLGEVDPATRSLQQDLAMPGMRVLQFGFGSGPDNEHLPENAPELSLMYSSTHDSDTARGWWDSLSADQQMEVGARGDVVWQLIDRVLASDALWAIVPVQDWIDAGSEARFNTPGTREGNWLWRVRSEALTPELAHRAHHTIAASRRALPRPHRPSTSK